MTWRQRHLVELGDVPRIHENAARVRVAAQQIDRTADLIDGFAVRSRPRAPLLTVDGTELAALVGPLVPDRNAVLVEIADVGVASQEPQELVDDRAQVQLLRRHERKALAQVEA